MGEEASTGYRTQEIEAYDVRRLHAARKQSAVMSMFDSLEPGQAISVVLDFDPARMKRRFEAFFAGDFTWICLELGPREWLVEIGRKETAR